MTGTYETMVLLDNREVKKGWDACKKQVTGLFEKHSAEIVSAKRWDELRLAFPVKRQLRGTYMLLYYQIDGSNLPAVRRELEYSETVLTHLTLTCEEIPDEAREPEAEFDLESVRVEETGIEAAPKPAPDAEGSAGGKASAPAAKPASKAEAEASKPTEDASTDKGEAKS